MKTVLLYLALVGGPLLGVVGMLQVGRGLTPPPAFGGTWVLTSDTTGTTRAAGCALPYNVLHIEQSGRRARVLMGESVGTADVEGPRPHTRSRLHTRTPLRAPVPMGTGACDGWDVEAEGIGSLTPAQLTGRLVPTGCACPPVPFRAEREVQAPSAPAH